MGPMGYIVPGRAPDAQEQFIGGISQNGPFCLDGNEKVKVDQAIGEQVAKCGHAAENSARGPEGRFIAREIGGIQILLLQLDRKFMHLIKYGRHLMIEHREMKDGSADTADHIKDEESLATPKIFQDRPEHPQDEHIDQYMIPSSVQEHIGDELVGLEEHGTNVMEGKKIDDARFYYAPEGLLGQEHQH